MIIYNVTISIDKEVENYWLDWMKNTHIPDVMQKVSLLQNYKQNIQISLLTNLLPIVPF